MIILNKFYTTEQMLNELAPNISSKTYRNNKAEFLQYLQQFFDYEILSQGPATMFIFHVQYEDWIPFKHKRNHNKKIDCKNEYTKLVDNECSNGGVFTAASLAKDLNDALLLPFDHKERTARFYIKEVLNGDEYDKSTRIWAKHIWDEVNYRFKWVELTEDELAYYRKGFQMEDLCDLEADYQAGLISYQEYKEGRFEAYLIAKAEADKKFESIYGFIPQRKYKVLKGAF